MNVFSTDHPINSAPSTGRLRLQRWVRKGFLFILLGYPLYLLLIGGPLGALKGHGCLNFIPEPIQLAGFAPTYPIWRIPHLRGRYADYMDLWYCDPNEADRETGWD